MRQRCQRPLPSHHVLSRHVGIRYNLPQPTGFRFVAERRGENRVTASERPPGTGNCYLWEKDIWNIYGELCDKGISIEDDIAARDEHDLTDFAIHDLDGNYIGIGGEE